MEQSAEVICDSIGPNGKRVTTFLVQHWRCIHAELLRHRLFSFSVASSRAIPYTKQMEQVRDNPAMPILWPKQHKGMQGTEVFEESTHDAIESEWLETRDDALRRADGMAEAGLSKQLCNRLLEPWVMTRCLVTATEFDNFFDLRHPWKTISMDGDWNPTIKGGTCRAWGTEVDLEFPAEYNIQDLAIKMKKAYGESEPTVLKEGEWHLPFVTDEDKYHAYDSRGMTEALAIIDAKSMMPIYEELIKLSAARCARTSYNKDRGKTTEDDLKLADMLMEGNHWSPFEHQAMALDEKWKDAGGVDVNDIIPEGCELRIRQRKDNMGRGAELWSRNFKGWTQARATLD